MLERLRRLLVHPRIPWIAAAVAVVFSLPALGLGLLADDYLHEARILGDPSIPPVDSVSLQLFEFFPGTEQGNEALARAGMLPWWAPPGLRASFLRPLAAWTHQADYLVWPHHPWLMHAHSLVWLALAVGVVALLYRRLHGTSVVAGLAALLLAMEDAHAGPAGWIANRNALIALVFAAAALLFHDRWRRRRWIAGAVLAAGAYALALMASEAALGITAYLFAHALLLDRGPPWKRVLGLAPYVAISALYLWIYEAFGYGTAGADTYVDPLGAPLVFAQAVVERVPVLLLNQLTPVLCDLWIAVPRGVQLGWSVVGAVVVGGLLWWLRPLLVQQRIARFWALGMVLCLLPVCASFPMDRLLLFCGVGGAGLLATAASWHGWPGRTSRGSRALRGVLAALLVLHLGAGVVLKPARFVALYLTLGPFAVAAREAPDDPAVADQTLVFVNGMSFLIGYIEVIRSMEGGVVPAGQDFLLHLLEDVELTRVDERTLQAYTADGLLSGPAEQLVRTPDLTFAPGDRFERAAMTVTVDEVTADGRPARVTYRFAVPLEDPSLRWLIWRSGELEAFEIPAVGETVRVHPTLPPMPRPPWTYR